MRGCTRSVAAVRLGVSCMCALPRHARSAPGAHGAAAFQQKRQLAHATAVPRKPRAERAQPVCASEAGADRSRQCRAVRGLPQLLAHQRHGAAPAGQTAGIIVKHSARGTYERPGVEGKRGLGGEAGVCGGRRQTAAARGRGGRRPPQGAWRTLQTYSSPFCLTEEAKDALQRPVRQRQQAGRHRFVGRAGEPKIQDNDA